MHFGVCAECGTDLTLVALPKQKLDKIVFIEYLQCPQKKFALDRHTRITSDEVGYQARISASDKTFYYPNGAPQ
jgi:hypothetical protein